MRLYSHLKARPNGCTVAVEVALLCRMSTQWQHVVTMVCWELWWLCSHPKHCPEVIISCCATCCTGQCRISNSGAWLHTLPLMNFPVCISMRILKTRAQILTNQLARHPPCARHSRCFRYTFDGANVQKLKSWSRSQSYCKYNPRLQTGDCTSLEVFDTYLTLPSQVPRPQPAPWFNPNLQPKSANS